MNKIFDILIFVEISILYIYIIFQIWTNFLGNGINTFVKFMFSVPACIFSIGYVCIVKKIKPKYIKGNKQNEKIYNCIATSLRYIVFIVFLILIFGLMISQNLRGIVNGLIYKMINTF